MIDTSFDEMKARCRSVGVRLLKPRGLRKYFILEKDGCRVRLAKSWEEARFRIGEEIQLLFENDKPPSPPSTHVSREEREP